MDKQARIAGIDVGGTFTDLIWADGPEGRLRIAKVPSTPQSQDEGVMAALAAAGGAVPSLDLIVHGTTVTTNAVLERRLARTGLITTQGFRDILELGRRTRPQAYGMTGQFTPVIPRDLRLEVPQRMDARGQILTPLDEDALIAAGEALLAKGCEAVVVHFLHAYANPAHEVRAGALLKALWPNAYITLGSDLLSESREFERGVTAAVNGSVQPIIERYLSRLIKALDGAGYRRDLLVMNGNGGMVPAGQVAREAAKTVMSGPASGVMAAAYVGRRAGVPDLLTYDMGGTSTDVALIRGAEPAVSSEIEIEYAMPIHVPMVDVRTVGAGGGSIARVNDAGLLEVGPLSAGAVPGPICYGRGGTAPTISDASLLLGRLDPAGFVGTEAPVAKVEAAFAELGAAMALSATEAAAAVIRVANTKMAGAIRMVSLSLGADPRDFALFAFGGAGPLHAVALARELGVPKVLIPARPGITNALGCVVADLRQDFVQTINRPLEGLDIAQVHRVFAEQAEAGRAQVEGAGVPLEAVHLRYSADMQFTGQTHVLRVPLEGGTPGLEELHERFCEAYFARFGVELPEIRPVLVNLNCSVIGQRPPLDLAALMGAEGRGEALEDARTGTRRVWFDDGWAEVPVYWRDHLPARPVIGGPALIAQQDTTVLIEPGCIARGDDDGNLIVEV